MGHAVPSSQTEAVNEAEPGPVELFVPGRLCLFGEHSDWAGSYARCASFTACPLGIAEITGVCVHLTSPQKRYIFAD